MRLHNELADAWAVPTRTLSRSIVKSNQNHQNQHHHQPHRLLLTLLPIIISLFSLIPTLQISSSISSYHFAQNPILFAQAAHQHQNLNHHQESISSNQPTAETIIQLSSANFNTQLIQHKSPFQHILLIQYYLPFSRFCAKFKPTYQKLSKRVHQWRNVIRLAQIDLANSNNSPIAHSWQIDSVPTLRVHPPILEEKCGQFMNEKLLQLNATMKQSELQKAMFGHYKEQQLFVETLNVTYYMDKWQLLRRHLVAYVREFVAKLEQQQQKNDLESLQSLPKSWPNLHVVKETKLSQLLQNHPRQELFLLVERRLADDNDNNNDSSELNGYDKHKTNSALQVMLDLSSSSARKAIRYFRAEENLPLFMDILVQLNKTTSISNFTITSDDKDLSMIKKNEAFWGDNENVALIYIDDAHPAIKQGQSELVSGFHSAINRLTSKDLELMEAPFVQNGTSSFDMSLPSAAATAALKSKRSSTTRNRRSSTSTAHDDVIANHDGLSKSKHFIELVVNFINHIHIDTSEDRAFLEELAEFDEHYASIKKTTSTSSEQHQSGASDKIIASSNNNNSNQQLNRLTNADQQQLQEGAENSINSSGSSSNHDTSSAPANYSLHNNLNHYYHNNLNQYYHNNHHIKVIGDHYLPRSSQDDYGDKLKAIEYIFHKEIVRHDKWSKTNIEQNLQRLRILLDLISSIKTWFPLPNAASRQFLDGIERFLAKEEARLQQSSQDVVGSITKSFDARELKHEIDRLRAEGKRFPNVEVYNVCKTSGYPCALWRLFHTLTAFEYQTLTQVRQQQQQQQTSSMDNNNNNNNNYLQPNAASLTSSPSPMAPIESESSANNSKLQSESEIVTSAPASPSGSAPIGRLISPPDAGNAAASLSLTITTNNHQNNNENYLNNNSTSQKSSIINNNNGKLIFSELDLPTPVLLVMKDYIMTFFSCDECNKNFETETSDLSLDKIRREKADFSLLELWRIHNLVNRRLAVTSEKNPPNCPKVWYPSYRQCKSCYNEVPSYISPDIMSSDDRVDPEIMFSEPIQWNTTNVLHFMEYEYTKNPLIRNVNILFGCHTWSMYIILALTILSFVIMTKTCCSLIERQRRHKSNLLNANGAAYSVELQ